MENPNSQEGYLDIGFVLEMSSINENWNTTINQDTLANLTNHAFVNSGYLELWHTSTSPDAYLNEEGISSGLWIDPTSTFSYLYALTGSVHGDLLSIGFWSESNQLNADSWDTARSKILRSLNHEFTLEEHRYDFEKSPQSFYINDFYVNGSGTLTPDTLSFALKRLQASSEVCSSAQKFLSLYSSEFQVIDRLPEFVRGHLWAQLLSACNWTMVQKIISQDNDLIFEAESFKWPQTNSQSHFYAEGWAVLWFRGIRRSLNFTPWPWQEGSITDQYDPDETALFRGQVKETLGREEPRAEERVATLAILFFLIAEDNDDYIYLSGRLQEIRDHWISEDLRVFLSDNKQLISECFAAMPEEWKEDGELGFLPEWEGSEGLLEDVPDLGASMQPAKLQFDPALVLRVDALWAEFIKIASQELPEGETA